MRVPERLEPLLTYGTIEEVVRPLMSGKEADVYLVRCDGEERVAKVYKNAQFRSFQNRADYTEGRRVRSSREQRAMTKGSRHGKSRTEDAWRSAEAETIQHLCALGVRVPYPFIFTEGVLVMELVKDEHGAPAPRLVDRQFTSSEALEIFHILLREVVKMLCAGIIHADLSDFNVLLGADGPVIIDFPQAVDPAHNRNGRKLLLRDVKNLTTFLGRFAPELRRTQYGPEMWDLYERNELEPNTPLTGRYEPKKKKAEVSSLLEEIMEIEREAAERREALGLPEPRRARRPIVREQRSAPEAPTKRKRRRKRTGGPAAAQGSGQAAATQQAAPPRPPGPTQAGSSHAPRPRSATPSRPARPDPADAPPTGAAEGAPSDPPRKRRRRRRRRGGGGGGGDGGGGGGGRSTGGGSSSGA
jgi:RIO kinase 1